MDPTKTKVLIVDDDPALLRMLSAVLEMDGYQVQTAADGLEAIDAIELDCPHVLITDWEMPHVDGLELCDRVRKLDLPHYVYVMLLTGRSHSKDIVQGLNAGADDFITKPVQRGELSARLKAGTRIVKLEQQLSHLANVDTLTGLPTRRSFYEQSDKELIRARRHKIPLSCVAIDLDFFKRINDTYGHAAGDTVLKSIGRVLKKRCRVTDLICRSGGEEFAVLLPETHEREAAQWAERVREQIAELEFEFNFTPVSLTVSFGIAEWRDNCSDLPNFLDRADQALLVAKQSGRDRVVCYSSIDDSTDLHGPFSGDSTDAFAGALAKHAMTVVVAPLEQDETIGQAAEFFVWSRLGSAPVVDKERKLVGIVTEQDLLNAMFTPDCWNQPISQLMKTNVVAYEEDAPVRMIYEFLCRVSIRQVIIVRNGVPVGIISRSSLVRWFNHWIACGGEGGKLPNPESVTSSKCSKGMVLEIVEQILAQATDFQQQLKEPTDDAILYIVGGASRIQELVNDLLAFSNFANESQRDESVGSTGLVHSVPIERNELD